VGKSVRSAFVKVHFVHGRRRRDRRRAPRDERRTHDRRFDRHNMISQYLRKRLDPIPPERRFTHDHIRRRSVADPARVRSADNAAFLEDRRETGERFESCLGAGVLVLSEGDGVATTLLRGKGDRSDLGSEGTSIEGCTEERSSTGEEGSHREKNVSHLLSIAADFEERTRRTARELYRTCWRGSRRCCEDRAGSDCKDR
jgi:hypothetical protein